MLSRISIKLKVLVAPLAVTLLFVAVSAGAVWLLHSQSMAFRQVVGGAFDAATATSTLSLTIAGIHSDIIRRLDVAGTRQNAGSMQDLRETLAQRLDQADSLMRGIAANAQTIDRETTQDLTDALAVYRILSTRVVTHVDELKPAQISSLMAQYAQLETLLRRAADVTTTTAKDLQRDTETFVARSVALLAVAAAATVCLGLVATWLVGRAISRPLTEMTGMMSRLARGEYELPVPAAGRRDELGEMADAVEVFRQASLQLRQRDAELARTVENLAEARDQAADASRAKSEFLASMSHELRTPLNAILGYAQLLQWEPELAPPVRDGLTTIDRSGRHLLALIDDILDLAKIEAGKRELNPGALDLQEFLEGIMDIIDVRAREKSLQFALETRDLPGAVEADERLLRQVLLNLLGNAMKFTDRGTVALRVHSLEDTGTECLLHFEVQDSGVGMSDEDLALLFRPFQQVGDLGRRRGGTGLGLAISRELVQLMGGDIHVESAVGVGSRFWFDLRLARAQALHAGTSEPVPIGYAGARRKVLIVDDVAENRLVLKDMLGPLGFLTFEACDGRGAVERAAELLPDVILMDNVMPVMGGFESTRILRGLAELRDVPVIAISASPTQADRDRASEAGVTDFLPKPFRAAQLLDLLERHLGLRFEVRHPT